LPVGAIMNCARNLYIIMATVKKGKPELRKKVMEDNA
nr:Chain V, 60S ribosomal protein L23-A [Saccharomyces cerevisiae BY4741]